jgi:hypothetical protein
MREASGGLSRASPKNHVDFPRRPEVCRKRSIQLRRFAPHDPDQESSFIQPQGLGVHCGDLLAFRKLGNSQERFHGELVDRSEVRRK